jgi:hypothetical protein
MGDIQPFRSTRAPLTVWGHILLVLFLLNGIGGVVGGIGVMKGTLPFPEVWLEGTPFQSYFLPGLILCVVVGGGHLAAVCALLWRHTMAGTASLLAGLILTGWMIGELKLIGFQAPIQVWFVGVGLIEIGLSFARLQKNEGIV